MNPNNQTIPDDEIDLKKIILTLWKEKYLILIITLVFTVAGFIYGILQLKQPKVYQSTIILRDVPKGQFGKYTIFLSDSNFNQEFKLNLISLNNLVNFVEQNKKIDEFKSYLKTNNIKTSTYFKGKFQSVTNKENKLTNQYTLNFSIELPGTEFLDDYIIFTKQVTENEFKNQLKERIKNEIEIYDQNLEIAKTINLENPILKSFAQGNTVVNEPQALFYKGSKVLSLKKHYLEELLKEIDNSNIFNYNPIIAKASNSTLVTKSSAIIFMSIAFAVGLFFSFIVIFIRSMFVR